MLVRKKLIIIALIIIICLIILTVGYWVFVRKSELLKENQLNQNQQNQRNQNKIRLNSEIVEEKVIASNGEGLPRFTTSEGENLVIAIYQYTDTSEKLLEKPGLLVFRYDVNGKVQKILKIEGDYIGTCAGKYGSKDLNKDGVDELIINMGCRGATALWIYVWQDGTFKFISAMEPPRSDDKIDNVFIFSADNNFQFIDVEGDGKIDISLLFPKGVRLGPNYEDFRTDIYRRIYKWDGTEKPYYLWKEEKIGEEKPEPIE